MALRRSLRAASLQRSITRPCDRVPGGFPRRPRRARVRLGVNLEGLGSFSSTPRPNIRHTLAIRGDSPVRLRSSRPLVAPLVPGAPSSRHGTVDGSGQTMRDAWKIGSLPTLGLGFVLVLIAGPASGGPAHYDKDTKSF